MSLRRNALLLVLATAVLAILGNWSAQPGSGFARLWRLPAALLLLGLAYEGWWVSRSALSLQVQTAARWFLGRPTTLRLIVRDSAARTQQVQLLPCAPAVLSMDRSMRSVWLRAGESGQIELMGTARRLGRFAWPPTVARIGGVLGLAWWSRQLQADAQLQVLPELLRDRERSVAADRRGQQAARQPGTGGEVLQLRDYRVGDPPRAIDWKASARLGRTISRDFSADQRLEILLAIDAGRASALKAGETDRLALYANVASRLAQRAALLDDRVGLVAYADRPLVVLAPAQGIAAVTRLRSALAELCAQDAEANPLLAALQIRSLVRQRSLIVLLTGLDEAAVLTELGAATRLLLPTHLPLIAAVGSEQAQRLAIAPVSDTLQAYQALAAQQFCETAARNLRALRSLGARAVLAPARNLDQVVVQTYLTLRQRRSVG